MLPPSPPPPAPSREENRGGIQRRKPYHTASGLRHATAALWCTSLKRNGHLRRSGHRQPLVLRRREELEVRPGRTGIETWVISGITGSFPYNFQCWFTGWPISQFQQSFLDSHDKYFAHVVRRVPAGIGYDQICLNRASLDTKKNHIYKKGTKI
jgi:hypothetical protein